MQGTDEFDRYRRPRLGGARPAYRRRPVSRANGVIRHRRSGWSLRNVGFTLREVKAFIASRSPAGDGWRELYRRKLTELDQRIAQAQAARTAIAHGLTCPHKDIFECSNFASGVSALLAGFSLEEAHEKAHSH
ncbi:hypothetical protein GCM10010182_01150 [Actinomadura cremea]|nr:hypothetical protein GCM10010182_01150 [Actinomadura cremea]